MSDTTPSRDTLRGLAISAYSFTRCWQHARGCALHWHSFTKCWQHARGLHLTLTFIYLTLATCSGVAPRLAFIHPMLATRSGPAPHIGIHLPDVGNTLGGCALHRHSFIRHWQHARGLHLSLTFIYPMLATRSGAVHCIGIHSPDDGNTLRGCAL
jgi:hypothetical protein